MSQLHGDAGGQSFKLQLHDAAGGWQDMYTRVDFTGWRYCRFDLGGPSLKDLGKIEAMSATSEKKLQKRAEAMVPATAAPAQQATVARMPGGPAGLLVGLSLSAAAIGSSNWAT